MKEHNALVASMASVASSERGTPISDDEILYILAAIEEYGAPSNTEIKWLLDLLETIAARKETADLQPIPDHSFGSIALENIIVELDGLIPELDWDITGGDSIFHVFQNLGSCVSIDTTSHAYAVRRTTSLRELDNWLSDAWGKFRADTR